MWSTSLGYIQNNKTKNKTKKSKGGEKGKRTPKPRNQQIVRLFVCGVHVCFQKPRRYICEEIRYRVNIQEKGSRRLGIYAIVTYLILFLFHQNVNTMRKAIVLVYYFSLDVFHNKSWLDGSALAAKRNDSQKIPLTSPCVHGRCKPFDKQINKYIHK